jgi:membrane protease YdiL (CAAX protease family)
MALTLRAAFIGMLVAMAGTIPRNILFAANLRLVPSVPWAVPATAVYLWFFWRYLQGAGPPAETSVERRESLRANRVSGRAWAWSLVAGGLGIVGLVLALRVANRLVVLPEQTLPDLGQVPRTTVVALLLAAAPIAGIVEESAFRGYMQRPIERRHGLVAAILVTGTMFAIAHLDFTLLLWPYYVAAATIYGVVAYLTDSILPAIVLHTLGNTYSNFDLLLHGKAEWQAAAGPASLIWTTGTDASFWMSLAELGAVAVMATLAYWMLARSMALVRQRPVTHL